MAIHYSPPDHLRKNLLDLQYHRQLQYYNTSLIALLTYFVGVAIAIITNQINLSAVKQLLMLMLFSAAFLGTIFYLLRLFRVRMGKIIEEVKTLHL
jgi:hypothetical protein